METKEILKEQIIKSTNIGLELADKIEFDEISKLIFSNEILSGVIVCGINNTPWMIALTNQRIFFIKKKNIYGSEIKIFGLEQIRDLKFKSFGNIANLIFETLNSIIEVDSINFDIARDFGSAIVSNVKIWNNNFSSYLI